VSPLRGSRHLMIGHPDLPVWAIAFRRSAPLDWLWRGSLAVQDISWWNPTRPGGPTCNSPGRQAWVAGLRWREPRRGDTQRTGWSMTAFGVIWFSIFILGFAVCGWLCVFRTSMLVEWGRRNYAKSRIVRAYPFSNMVLKPWYPTYIRCAGVFIWLWAIAIVYAVLFLHFR
jgi:hypothetical protein